MSFSKLVAPSSVAVVGASSSPDKVGYSVFNNLICDGFEGKIYPVNNKAESILGHKCYPKLSAIAGPVDCAIIVVPRNIVLSVINDCREKGVASVVIITAGFGETGAEGKKLQERIVQECRSARITMMGPNCLGIINPWHKFNGSFGQSIDIPGHIALVSQSGALLTSVQDLAAATRLGFSVLASIGNKAALDEVDFLEQLNHDDNTRVIAGYLENISRGQEFMRVAERVSKNKPVVLLKSGRTSAGAKAASSHTGSLAGADAAYDCAFSRTGVIRVDSIEHLFDVSMALAYQPLPAGDRVAVVTNAGGPGIMMSDALEMNGLTVAPLSEQTRGALEAIMPPAASWRNPVDVLGDAGPEIYASAMDVLLRAPEVDALMVILTPQKMTDDTATAQALIDLSQKYGKPVFACFMGGDSVKDGIELLRQNSIPQYPIPERAARAMLELVSYGKFKSRPLRVVNRFAVNKNPCIRMVKSYRDRGSNEIGEIDAKTIMKAYNFDLPPGAAASSVDEAVALAQQLGFPLAMKISSPDILHKSDVGGVSVGLRSVGEVEDAFELMMLRVKRKRPDADVKGVLLEKMVSGGREVILGMNKDPQFGPMIMFGLGGIFVEVLKDVTFSLAPVTADEIRTMISSTRSYKLLTGARGKAPNDIGAIVENIQRMSQLVIDFPEIDEIDLNPLMVGAEGDGAFVVDARIILSTRNS